LVSLRKVILEVVEISRNAGSYALIASASLRPNAEALSKLAQAAGNTVSTTRTSLQGQSSDLQRFVNQVSVEANPVAELETARGLSRSSDISATIVEALKVAEHRFAYTESRNSSRSPNTAGSSTGAAIVAMLRSAQSDYDGFDFSALIRRYSGSSAKPSQIAVSAARQDLPDVFERGIPLTTAVGGAATTTITKTALRAQSIEIALDKTDSSLGSIQGLTYVPDGSARSDNEGFYIRTVTGSANDTVVLDTRDPTGDDSRLSAFDVDTGDGSDVIFIAGNNVSRINAGAGDDFVAVEGDAIVDGGDGNDLIYARTASGDAGDDIIFTDGFGSGGDGNDSITLFSLDAENDDVAKIAYGGAGNDEIVASIKASIDGGDGEDVLILREGGFAGGGNGDDRISAWNTATVEGGAGNDDIKLLLGGSVDAGEGNDKVVATNYTSVVGGKGNDIIELNGGGVYTFNKGDGSDIVTIDKTRFGDDDINKTLANRVVLEGYDFTDLNVVVGALTLDLTPTVASTSGDKLHVDREVLGKLEVVFRKNGFEQVLKIDGLTQTLGAKVPYTPAP
jgi:Ca2+-binding RTX toxin-like protein